MKIDLGYYKKVALGWTTFQKIYDVIIDVEQKAKDGQITPEERQGIAIYKIKDILADIGAVGVTTSQIGAVVDLLVSIFNAVGMFGKRR